jgi:hypothetical protein
MNAALPRGERLSGPGKQWREARAVEPTGVPVLRIDLRSIVAFLACAACVAALATRAGEARADSLLLTRILFIGNALTNGRYPPVLGYNAAHVKDEDYDLPPGNPRRETVADEPGPYGGIPGIFKQFTDERGLRYDVHLELIDGKTLEYQSVYGMRIIARPWNQVVVQDEADVPLPPERGGHLDNFLEFATAIEEKIHSVNPDAAVFLYETWARADRTYRKNAPYYGESIDVMARDLHKAYYEEFVTDRHFQDVAPAGDAWLLAISRGYAQSNPYDPEAGRFDLWNDDGASPSVYGAYLNACVIFETVTGENAESLGAHEIAARDLGIAPQEATELQEVAHDQILAAAAAGR